MASLVRKLINIKRDYIEIIRGDISVEKDKKNINGFLNQVRLNKGKIRSVQISNRIDTKCDSHEEYEPSSKQSIYDTGYVTKIDSFIETSSYFIIHYRCYKELEYKKEDKTIEKKINFGIIDIPEE
jgi:hypothetical protein